MSVQNLGKAKLARDINKFIEAAGGQPIRARNLPQEGLMVGGALAQAFDESPARSPFRDSKREARAQQIGDRDVAVRSGAIVDRKPVGQRPSTRLLRWRVKPAGRQRVRKEGPPAARCRAQVHRRRHARYPTSVRGPQGAWLGRRLLRRTCVCLDVQGRQGHAEADRGRLKKLEDKPRAPRARRTTRVRRAATSSSRRSSSTCRSPRCSRRCRTCSTAWTSCQVGHPPHQRLSGPPVG